MSRRHWALAAVASVVWGSLATVGGYAWYLRSDAYRRICERDLSEYLELPAEIGRVVPRSLSTREFRDITVYLPDRRGRAFFCDTALLVQAPNDADPEAYELELVNGACELSDRTWLREDYRHVLESGLRPSFDEGGPSRVQFSGMDIRFQRERFSLALDDATGQVAFPSRTIGHASVYCRTFNGRRMSDDVRVRSTLSPHDSGIRVDSLELTVPRLPLSLLKLDQAAGVIRGGEFAGRLTYAESDAGRALSASGECYNIDLSEWTAGLTPTPWRGRCPEMQLAELRVVDRALQRLRFRGVLTDVRLGDVLATWGMRDVGGELALRVGEVDLAQDGIRRLVASGICVNVSLAGLTRYVGWGEMTGDLTLRIDDLTIKDNRIASLDASIRIQDAVDAPNHIEGRLIREVVSQLLKLSLPPVLPENIEYTRFGLRLQVRDEELRIFGSHGPREKTILTVRLFGQDFPLVSEPEHAIDLKPLLDPLRERMLREIRQRMVPPQSVSPASVPSRGSG